MLSVPRDILGAILSTPSAARFYSYTCKEAAVAAKGLFQCKMVLNGYRAIYTVESAYFSSNLLIDSDYATHYHACGVSTIYVTWSRKELHRVIKPDHIIVEMRHGAFLADGSQRPDITEFAGINSINVRAIYKPVRIYKNFTGVSYADVTTDDPAAEGIFIKAINVWRTHTKLCDIRGNLIELQPIPLE